MAKVLITYGTTEGQSAKIADLIGEVMRRAGHHTEALDIKRLSDAVAENYDAVIVGASIHMGKHDKHIVKFATTNRDLLDRLPSALFSVSLAAHTEPQEARRYVDEFQEQTGWHPQQIALFGGALLYTQYGFIKRQLMKRIAGEKPGHLGTDISRDYIYTEWELVTRFAEDFSARLESTTV